jgi:hypothetical protein
MNAYRREVAVHEQLVQRVRTVHLQETAGHVSERKREWEGGREGLKEEVYL